MARRPRRRWPWIAAAAVTVLFGIGLGVFWEDIMRTGLDPKAPFQTYRPPPAPDYASRDAWLLIPAEPARVAPGDPPADVFFVSPTTFDGGKDWNAPIGDHGSDKLFREVVAPNYAGPYVRVGRIFAPRYRQASLYTQLTLREDAQEARRFAYGDVAQAFRFYLAHYNQGRPFVIAGVEQGGLLAARLVAEEVAAKPEVGARMAAAYLQETIVPAASPPAPPCVARGQPGCVAAWTSVRDDAIDAGQAILDRALVWAPGGELKNLSGRPALCFNPLLGATTDQPAPARLAQGAANATGLEWGARPAFLIRQLAARCDGGLLRIRRPKSPTLRRTGDWAERRRVPGYNLFWADIENDARARVAALLSR